MNLPSSDKLIGALIRDGFHARGKSTRGSHQAFRKESPEGAKTVVVPLGKKEIPRGTLRSIMRQAGLTEKQLAKLIK
ncbi:MAG: type II toxin-antitoxin system HicA family toxin [Dehalococcoidia bacterium]